MIHVIPQGQRIWQSVAAAYRPPNDPFALYAQDEEIGKLHAGTLAINFEMGVNTLSMHNAWMVGDWFAPYPLRLPPEDRMDVFPNMVTPEQAAQLISYEIPLTAASAQQAAEADVPAWVLAYRGYLLNQIDQYGFIVRRQTRGDFF